MTFQRSGQLLEIGYSPDDSNYVQIFNTFSPSVPQYTFVGVGIAAVAGQNCQIVLDSLLYF